MIEQHSYWCWPETDETLTILVGQEDYSPYAWKDSAEWPYARIWFRMKSVPVETKVEHYDWFKVRHDPQPWPDKEAGEGQPEGRDEFPWADDPWSIELPPLPGATPELVETVGLTPLDVVEDWQLQHHVALAIHAIAAYRVSGNLQSLRDAAWWLQRYIDNEEAA